MPLCAALARPMAEAARLFPLPLHLYRLAFAAPSPRDGAVARRWPLSCWFDDLPCTTSSRCTSPAMAPILPSILPTFSCLRAYYSPLPF